jgi:hypothetical protein
LIQKNSDSFFSGSKGILYLVGLLIAMVSNSFAAAGLIGLCVVISAGARGYGWHLYAAGENRFLFSAWFKLWWQLVCGGLPVGILF